MTFEMFYVAAVVVTAVMVAGVVVLVVRDRRRMTAQQVEGDRVIARLHGRRYAADVDAGVRVSAQSTPTTLRWEGSCESCHQQPATVSVTVVDRPPFRVCTGCLPIAGTPGMPVTTVTPLPARQVRRALPGPRPQLGAQVAQAQPECGPEPGPVAS